MSNRSPLITTSINRFAACVLIVYLLTGCGLTQTSNDTPTPRPSATAQPSPSSTPTISPTPDPYSGLRIEELAEQEFGSGTLEVDDWAQPSPFFKQAFFQYPSDGLTIHGFINEPVREGPFPVVIVLHGNVDEEDYQTLTYTARYANALAETGFVVLHPNYRNYPPSDQGKNPFGIGYTRDVLNLIEIVRAQSGQTGPLEKADPDDIGLFGHSMGGEIAQRVITVDREIDAALLYNSMSGNALRNYEVVLKWSDEAEEYDEYHDAPKEVLKEISPYFYIDRIQAAVSIHHGTGDIIPLAWSEELCQMLKDSGKTVECFTYNKMPHTFYGEKDELLINHSIRFFREHLTR